MNQNLIPKVTGLQFMPVLENKRPIFEEWQNTRKEYDFSKAKAIGLVCGKISDYVQAIDVDNIFLYICFDKIEVRADLNENKKILGNVVLADCSKAIALTQYYFPGFIIMAQFKKYEKQNFSCIYQITSKLTGKKYIGSAKHFGIRRRNHIFQLSKKKHHSVILQNHVNKYGLDDLTFSILEFLCWDENVINREQYFLDLLSPEFNILKVAGSNFGRKTSEQTKIKLVNSHLGKKPSKESLKKRSDTMKYILSNLTVEEKVLRLESARLSRVKSVICNNTGVIYESIRQAEKETGCDNIHSICCGKYGYKSSNGLTFSFYIV